MGRRRKIFSVIAAMAALGLLSALGLSASSSASPSRASRSSVSPSEATASIGGPTWVTIYRDIAGSTDPATFQHPGSFRLDSADSFIVFRHLHWRGWNGQRAVAHGRAKTCGEGGIEGFICRKGRVRLVADTRAECRQGYLYLSLTAYKVPLYGPKVEIPVSPTRCS